MANTDVNSVVESGGRFPKKIMAIVGRWRAIKWCIWYTPNEQVSLLLINHAVLVAMHGPTTLLC